MTDWLDDPRFKDMDPAKVNLIRLASTQTAGKSGNALAPVLMALITSANRKQIQFSQDEIALILEIFKEGRSKKEQEQIDQTIQMVTAMMKNWKA